VGEAKMQKNEEPDFEGSKLDGEVVWEASYTHPLFDKWLSR
jgi:hypothetical protein